MSRTSSGLWLALAVSIATAGCGKDTIVPTAATPAADRHDGGASLSDNNRDNNRDDDRDSDEGDDDRPFTYAVIGDMPYGKAKRDSFPAFVDLINNDPAVERVLHAGDIKAGSGSPCTDAYFADIRTQFDRFQDPLVYTPGDNEWTDCHVAVKNNGLFWPTERLIAVRNVFFNQPGWTLGVNRKRVTSQGLVDAANSDYIENVRWTRADIVFASLNITGTNNDKGPWTSSPALPTELPAGFALYPTQAQEQATRAQATNAWLDQTFARAKEAKAIVLLMQADMWDGTLANRATTIDGYDALVIKIGTLAAKFGRPVLLIEGDSHLFRVDQPFTPSSPLFGLHPNTPVAPNVTRLVMNGSTNPTEYVRMKIDPSAKKGTAPWTFEEVFYK